MSSKKQPKNDPALEPTAPVPVEPQRDEVSVYLAAGLARSVIERQWYEALGYKSDEELMLDALAIARAFDDWVGRTPSWIATLDFLGEIHRYLVADYFDRALRELAGHGVPLCPPDEVAAFSARLTDDQCQVIALAMLEFSFGRKAEFYQGTVVRFLNPKSGKPACNKDVRR